MACELNNIYDLCILPNQTFKLPFTLKNDDGSAINISSWSFEASIKERVVDTAPILFFTMSLIDPTQGSAYMYLSAQTTWQLKSARYVYDVIATNNEVTPPETLRILQGKISTRAGVTSP